MTKRKILTTIQTISWVNDMINGRNICVNTNRNDVIPVIYHAYRRKMGKTWDETNVFDFLRASRSERFCSIMTQTISDRRTVTKIPGMIKRRDHNAIQKDRTTSPSNDGQMRESQRGKISLDGSEDDAHSSKTRMIHTITQRISIPKGIVWFGAICWNETVSVNIQEISRYPSGWSKKRRQRPVKTSQLITIYIRRISAMFCDRAEKMLWKNERNDDMIAKRKIKWLTEIGGLG